MCSFIYPKRYNLKFQTGEEFYSCVFQSEYIAKNHPLNFYCKHPLEVPDDHVCNVQFKFSNIEKIPRGLTEKFLNLKILNIFKSRLMEISKNDSGNELQILPGDLFEGFNNLQFINFSENKSKIIEPDILDGLNNFKYVNFSKNPNFDRCFSVYEVYKPNATLKEVKDQLLEKYGSSLDQLKNMNELMKTNMMLKNQLLDVSDSWYYAHEEVKSENNNLIQEIYEFRESEEKLKLEIANLKSVKPQTDLAIELTAYIQDETTKDFKIIINEHEFSVHKFLMAARSPTLADLFRNNPETGILKLTDISVEIFETILKFLYTDELPSEDGTNFLNIFSAAGKLKIEKLVKYAAPKILDQVNQDNNLNIFCISANFDLNELKENAFEEVKNKYKEVNFDDKLKENPDDVIKIIQNIKKKEEALKDFEEELKKLSIKFSAEDLKSNTDSQ